MKLEPVNYPVVRINAPELAKNDKFVDWLNQRTCATWHTGDNGGRITDFSDIFTWIEKGEGNNLRGNLQEVTHEGEPELLSALEAIEARINGVYDCPALVAFGPLHHDIQWDCLRIAEEAIAKAKGEIK